MFTFEALVASIRTWALRAVTHYKIITSLLVVLASAFYGLAFSRFYGELNTTPEAVGISAPQMVARSAVGGALFLAVVTFACAALVAPWIPIGSGSIAPQSQRRTDAGGFLSVIGLGVVNALVWLWMSHVEKYYFNAALVFLLLVGFVPSFVCLRCKLRPPRFVGFRPLRFRAIDFGALAILSAMVLLVPLAGSTIVLAGSAGEAARAGSAVSPVEYLGFSMLGVESDPAVVRWVGKSRAHVRLPSCVSYLGKSGNSLVVYDPIKHRTMQLSSEDVALSVEEGRTSCRAPMDIKGPSIKRRDGELVCQLGRWSRWPRPQFSVRWTANAYPVETVRERRFRPYHVDDEREIQCEVEAANAWGSDIAYSPLVIPAAHIPVAHSSARHRKGPQ